MARNAATRTLSSPSVQSCETVSIAEAKAHFSEVVSTVEQRRQPVTILRRNRPIAQIVPMQMQAPSLYGSMRGTVVELGDIVGPTGGEWSVGDE